MKNLFYICGPSSSGKDTIYSELLKEFSQELMPVVIYTTRPLRHGEKDGREYHFVTEADILRFESEGRLIEKRIYHTVHGDWTYATVSDEELAGDDRNYLAIGTLESYVKIKDYYGEARVHPILLHVDEGMRLKRALDRELSQEEPKYCEMCRRFLADSQDFSEEKIREAGIVRVFENKELDSCLDEIRTYITQQMD